MLFITPAWPPNNTAKNLLLLHGLNDIFSRLTSKNFRGIDAKYFGSAAVFVGNATQLRRDTFLTQGITVLVLVVFLGLYFRKKSAPFIILIPVLFGSLFSLTAIYFIKGGISVIALGTGSVVLGIAVNYSLHIFNHYRHTKSVEQVIKDLMLPLTVGSFTTIGGFLCLEFVESEMLKDLGLFAAFSLIGASFCSLVFLPQFIATKKEQEQHNIIEFSWIDQLASYNPEYNKFIVAGIIALTFVFTYTARYVRFQFDITGMNYMSPELKKAETKLNAINKFSLQSVYLVTEGKTLDQALVNNERLSEQIEQLKKKKIVIKYSGVSSFIISDSLQKERVKRWKSYWTPEKKRAVFAVLEKEGQAAGFKAAAFNNFKQLVNRDYTIADKQNITDLRKSFLDDFITEKPGQVTVVTLVQTTPKNKQVIYEAFNNDARVTVVDKQYLTNKLVQIINSDFTRIAVMSSLLVLLVLWLTYGRIELTLVSFIPMFISWIWILGIMGLFGIEFNIVNIIISALIFGLGDDYSLYIMDGLLQEYKTGKKVLSSYKTSIFLSAITTVTGLGVLIFARHPSLKSIAIISIIGICCVVIMAQILIPFLFNILVKDRTGKKQFPWTLTSFLKTIFAFVYFVTGCILLTILGVLFKLNPFNKEKGKLAYHYMLSKCAWSLVYIMANVKKRIYDKELADFSKPSVIISNHQSFLDILCIVMQHPKLILFTNNWVWNSPVFGVVARMADFYPVSSGAENSIELIAGRVKQGYSIAVFPEGTRSPNGVVKRFHKGAFYLAEQLKLDIQPVMLHGTGYSMTKGDFMLKDGRISIKYLPRISAGDASFGDGFAERTKLISQYFKKEYCTFSHDVENPGNFKEQLIYNFLYKGPVIEWYLKIKIRVEKNYRIFNDLLPRKGKILDVGCGYGFMSYLLHYVSPERIITGIDYDEDKIETAANCFSRDNKINFIFATANGFNFGQYDAIVMADVLHYLQPEEQKQLIEKSIRHLNPNGVIIIRDGNKDLTERHKGTRLMEFFSTRFIGFNKTSAKGLSFLSANLVENTAHTFNMKCGIIDETKFTSDVIFVLKHQLQN